MPNWLPLAGLVVIFFAIAPIFSNKAIQIHGPIINFLILNIIFGIFGLIWFLFSGRQDIDLVSSKSLGLTTIAGIISFFGVAFLYSAYKLAPKDLSFITITTSFSVVVLAIINNFLGNKLALHHWIGAIIAFIGIALVNYKK
ncbi:MAG: EamA family transporter [Candidatus Yanofskybacteria bacterium]|nr:EamA family transporter [Candidatus Yanofskybacteria bacterium]